MSWHSDDRAHSHGPGGSPWADDEALGADLTTALAERETYDRVVASADVAFRAHRGMVDARAGLEMDLLLLELVYDSDRARRARRRPRPLRRHLAHARVRGPRPRRRGGGRVVVDRRSAAAGHAGRVTLRTPDGVVATIETDDVGYFRFDVHPDGPLRLECSSEGGTCLTAVAAVLAAGHPRTTKARSAGGTGPSSCWRYRQAASSSSRFRVLFWSTRMPGPFVVEKVALAM